MTPAQKRLKKDRELLGNLLSAAVAYNTALFKVKEAGLSHSNEHELINTNADWAVYRTFKTGHIQNSNTPLKTNTCGKRE